MARFTEDTPIRQSNLSTGAAQGIQSLSARLDNFASQQAQVGARHIATQAAEAEIQGQAQFDPEQPLEGQRQDVPAFFGHDQQAFNKGLRAAYVAGVDSDNRSEISRIAAENPDNLLIFNDAADAYSKSVLNGIDPTARGVISQSLNNQVNNARIQVQGNTIKRQKKETADALNINAESAIDSSSALARNGDMQGAAGELQNAFATIDEMDIASDQKALLKREAEKGVTEESLLGELDRDFDTNGAQAAMDSLDGMSDNVPKGWAADEWTGFINKAQTGLNRKIARQAKQGKADLKAIELDNSIKRGLLFTDSGIPADPAKGSQDRKDVNNYYDSVAGEWSQLPIQDQIDINVDFVENTGLVPDRMISNVNASMRSGTPEQVAVMSDVISRIQEISPASLKDIPDESRSISLQVSDAVKAGVDPVVALEQARKATFGLTDSEKTTISAQSQEAAKGLNSSLQSFANLDADEGGFDTGIFSSVPDVSPAMLGEYKNSFDRFMKMTGGDVEQAQKLSYGAIKSTWGVTETGGSKRFMKYAPEVIYGKPNSNNHWVENQFNEEMEEAGHLGAIIAVDHSVAREDQPSYPILVTDQQTGIMKPLLNADNMPVRWKPDFKSTEQYKELSAPPENRITKAKKQRGVNLTRRANEVRRLVQSRLLSAVHVPFNERADFMASDEGKQKIDSLIGRLSSSGKLDEVEAKEARKAFGVN